MRTKNRILQLVSFAVDGYAGLRARPAPQHTSPDLEEKRRQAIEYLRRRKLWVLDAGSKKPDWGVPGS